MVFSKYLGGMKMLEKIYVLNGVMFSVGDEIEITSAKGFTLKGVFYDTETLDNGSLKLSKEKEDNVYSIIPIIDIDRIEKILPTIKIEQYFQNEKEMLKKKIGSLPIKECRKNLDGYIFNVDDEVGKFEEKFIERLKCNIVEFLLQVIEVEFFQKVSRETLVAMMKDPLNNGLYNHILDLQNGDIEIHYFLDYYKIGDEVFYPHMKKFLLDNV
jgi:hypothetical protein